MKLSIQRLRWVLITGAVLLVVVLTAYIGYGRFRALRTWHQLLAKSGATVTHDTNGFTYSQSVQGKTIFTVHAKKATQLGDGKWALHDADMILYGRMEGREDHIYSSEIEYDQNEGVARAHGEVLMDLQAPESLTGGRGSGQAADLAQGEVKAESSEVIHVKTSGLVYQRKLGVAATEQQVEFRYGNMICTAMGAEFNTDQSTLNLLADVVMDGDVHEQPFHLTAVKADMDRTNNVATLTNPVITSQGRIAKAQGAAINLRKDGSIERVQGNGGVVMTSGTQQVTAQRLDANLNPQSVLETAKLTGSVALVDTDAMRPMHGSAAQVEALFTTQGAVKVVTATGGAKFEELDKKTNVKGLARSLEGARVVATFVPAVAKGRKQTIRLSELHAAGGAKAHSESVDKANQRKALSVAGDDLRMTLEVGANGKSEPQMLYGAGHTMLQQDAALGEQEMSSGDALEMKFAPEGAAGDGGPTISSAIQTGRVTIHDRAATRAGATEPGAVSTATAERASYDGATQRLTLTGDSHGDVRVEGDNAELMAPMAWMDQKTQDAGASGGVRAVMRGSQAGQPTKEVAVTHVLAASAHLQHATKLIEFRGTDAVPAKMWQEASQVQAAVLVFDGLKHTLSARPVRNGVTVHAVFAGKPDAGKRTTAGIVRVASPKMDYNDVQHEATFGGGVTIDGTMGEVRGEWAVVFLQPAAKAADGKAKASAAAGTGAFSGSLDRVVVSGNVQMDQPGRHGTGDQLLYNAVKDDYVLTGSPGKLPKIVDARQGSVTGATLLFGDAGSTIVVVGDADKKSTAGRVRTETEVRQQ